MKNEIIAFVFGFVSAPALYFAFTLGKWFKGVSDNGGATDTAGEQLEDCGQRIDTAQGAVEDSLRILEEVRKGK